MTIGGRIPRHGNRCVFRSTAALHHLASLHLKICFYSRAFQAALPRPAFWWCSKPMTLSEVERPLFGALMATFSPKADMRKRKNNEIHFSPPSSQWKGFWLIQILNLEMISMPENFPELTIQANSPCSNYEMMSQNNFKNIVNESLWCLWQGKRKHWCIILLSETLKLRNFKKVAFSFCCLLHTHTQLHFSVSELINRWLLNCQIMLRIEFWS